MKNGRLEWIGRAPVKRGAIEALEAVELGAGAGLDGDHHARSSSGGNRQVTLIQADHLQEVAALLQRSVTPDLCRRNLVVSGLSLQSLRDRRFQVGEALLEGTGDCHPCERMEQNLGPGGKAAMRERGGITARILRGGKVRIGDLVHGEIAPGDRTPSLSAALVLGCLLLGSCGGEAGSASATAASGSAQKHPADSAPINAPELYAQNCALCHGPNGDGDGSLKLDRPARSFRAGGFSFGNTEEAVYRTITSGIGGSPMPGFQTQLNDAQRRAVARHVISLGPEQVPGPGLSSILTVGDRPVVVRAHLPALVEGAAEFPRGLLIGNPDGLSYEYRADDLRLLAVRQGPFADRKDWGERGGSPIEPLGRLIFLADADGEPGAAWLTEGPAPLRAQLLETSTAEPIAVLRFSLHAPNGAQVATGSESMQAATAGSLAGYRRSIHLDPGSQGLVALRLPASVIVSQPAAGKPAWYRLREGQQELALGVVHGAGTALLGEPVLTDAAGLIEYLLLILPDGSDATWAAIAKETIR